ncbi:MULTISPECIES: glycosyltransferase family 4 protein [Kamptonema]|uniref:glycosyltransferase family 4 protein n=1 Tax=Kamptonema TaxID=1501433 RepID=UPI0001DAD2FE|nr:MULTISPECIES: glycosyltransferase family 4 protein [Kamptonema]CBN54678.1 Glycosyl transferase, group 1 family protein [Kamptonema sp. PCC 6506]
MKILLSAFACEPGQGSEEGVGWNTVVEAAKHQEVWVLTRTFYREAIEAELAERPIANLHFIYIEPLGWKENFKGRQGGVQLHYYLWQILAYFVARSLHRKIGFDIARHVTYVKFWSPSFISLLPIPFIWGPVGGGEAAPRPFWKDFSFKGKLYETAREWAQKLGASDPFARITARRSVLALATTEDTAKRVRAMGAKKVQVLSEAYLSKTEMARLREYKLPEASPIRFISMGRLLHWKGYHLAVRAFGIANLPNTEYWLLGDGPERDRLESLIAELGIASQVKLWGRLPRQESLGKLEESHVLIHPSLHDSGGWTCLEGMAAGRPIVCFDLGGPATQVTAETGIKVPGYHPKQAVNDLAEAIARLADDPELRSRMGQAGQKRVAEVYDWDVNGQFFAQLCEDIVAQQKYKL